MSSHLIFFVEEQSMEAFLRAVLPRLLPDSVHFEIFTFQGKRDLIEKLPKRLRGLAPTLAANSRIVVLVDCDDDDCRQLKSKLNEIAVQAGLKVRNVGSTDWQVVNRIVVEELEAWYFGDWDAVREAFPRVSANVPRQQQYRDSDGIAGGTWEALERLLKKAGYYNTGIAKIELAHTIGQRFQPDRCKSPSFRCFRGVVLEAVVGSQ